MQFLAGPILAVVALIPAAVVLWRGRTIAAQLDDPALNERLLVHRSRMVVITCVCLGFLISTPGSLGWSVPLLLVSRMAAGYPLRIRLHRESWSLAVYLGFIARLVIGVYGFWLLLGMTPALANLAGSRDWIAAVLLCPILLTWNERYGAVLRAILGGRAVTNTAVAARFETIRAACGLGAVRLEQVDLRGGVFANAVALPSMTAPAVLISSTIVDQFDEDEAAAVLAHELAHIEHFNPGRLRTLNTVSFMIIVCAVALTPMLRTMAPAAIAPALAVWPVVLIVMLALRARQQQANETAADLRAIALTGNGAALIRALTKLHALGRVPRRLDADVERQASHPSLARRIQAIHTAEGTPPASLGEAALFAAADGNASVTFLDDRVLWNEGPASHYTLDYAQLTILRVDVRKSDAARLIATDSAGRRWGMRLRHDDLVRAQATLDIVDTRLAGIAPAPAVSAGVLRMLAWLTMLLAMTTGQYAVALVAVVAVVCPALPLVVATGAASMVAAAVAGREHAASVAMSRPWYALALLISGVAVVALAATNKRERVPALATRLAILVAAMACVPWIAIALGGFDPIALHHAARQWPSAATLTMSVGAMIAVSATRKRRYAAAPLAIAAVAVAFAGSPEFLDRFASDPFLVSAPAISFTTLDATPSTEVVLPFQASHLRISPRGGFIAVSSEDEDEKITIHAGRIDAPLTAFAAVDALFVDEGRLLLLEGDRDGSILKLVDAAAGHTEWSLRTPVAYADLSFDPAARRWSVLGWTKDEGMAAASGIVGESAFEQQRWNAGSDDDQGPQPIVSIDGALLALDIATIDAPSGTAWLWQWAPWLRTGTTANLSLLEHDRRSAWLTSRLRLQCRGGSARAEGAICTAFDGSRTRFVRLDPIARRRDALASIDGRFAQRENAGNGWILGWCDRGAVLVQPATHTGIRLQPDGQSIVRDLAITDTMVGAVSAHDDGSIVRLYRRDSGRLRARVTGVPAT